MSKVVLGIDLGTSLVKAAVFDLDGTPLAEGSRPVELHHHDDGRVEQDMDDFYRAAAEASRAATSALPAGAQVAGIAIAGQMAGVGLVDADHRPVAPFDSWLDSRCGSVVEAMSPELTAQVVATAGCAPTVSIGPKMRWWHEHRPQVLAEATSFVTAAGYVAGRAAGLRGADAFIDPSHLHFTAVADLGSTSWDESLVEQMEIDPKFLPRIVESTEIVGATTSQAARDFGVPVGVPIAAGCGDTAAGAVGAGVIEEGQVFDIAGTAAVLGVCTSRFVPDEQHRTLMTMRAALPGRWYALAYVGGAGQVVEWACRELLGHSDLSASAYDELGRLTEMTPPGNDGVLLLPHFAGRVAPAAPDARGAVVGLTANRTRGHLARAVLESIAYEYRGYLDVAGELVPDLELVSVTGIGGGSQSAVWNQVKADVTGVRYAALRGVEAGTRGAALVAMAALGLAVPELGPAARGTQTLPDPATHEAYRKTYEDYRWWAGRLVDAFHDRATERRSREDGK